LKLLYQILATKMDSTNPCSNKFGKGIKILASDSELDDKEKELFKITWKPTLIWVDNFQRKE
jgi:hypothetical protein